MSISDWISDVCFSDLSSLFAFALFARHGCYLKRQVIVLECVVVGFCRWLRCRLGLRITALAREFQIHHFCGQRKSLTPLLLVVCTDMHIDENHLDLRPDKRSVGNECVVT